jgi:hypothetical protein
MPVPLQVPTKSRAADIFAVVTVLGMIVVGVMVVGVIVVAVKFIAVVSQGVMSV